MTRKSGFKSHPDSTGGEYQIVEVGKLWVPVCETLQVKFKIPRHNKGDFIGFGGWFSAPDAVVCRVSSMRTLPRKIVLTSPCLPDWSKVGSMWRSDGAEVEISFEVTSISGNGVALWNMNCGVIKHPHLANARLVLLENMHQFSPEAHFYKTNGDVSISISNNQEVKVTDDNVSLYLKSCNRCARFLPVNIVDERNHLSFTNHCVAVQRRPCSHTGFGRLRNVETGEILQLQYGYQLECRFCKKFEVNAAHNPQRTASQMKEDAARRRSFELLLMELYGGSPQMLYRHKTGNELTDDIWNKFGRRCFKCNTPLPRVKSMHLDHTRPLALLWPLDETATALCGSCNSQKRDRPPAHFYNEEELGRLSEIINVPVDELKDPSPNREAIDFLAKRLDWFFEDFLTKQELTNVREGKTAGELLVKALQKALNKLPGGPPFDLQKELDRRRTVR